MNEFNVAPERANAKLSFKDLKHNQRFILSNYSAVISSFCRELHPDAKTDADAVLIHQKELQRTIDFKIQYSITAAEDIEMFFILHQVRNELTAKELMEEEII